MSDRIKRVCRWMLMLAICAVGVRNLTGCFVHDDRDHGHDYDHHDDHYDHDDHH